MRPSLRSLSAVVVALAGCGAPPGFSRLGDFSLSITDATEQLLVGFVYDQKQHGCQTLDRDFSAEMNGTPALGLFPGKIELPFGSCDSPMVVLSRPDVFGETATITASSGGDTLTVEVEDIGMALGGHPILAPGEAVHAGQVVRLALDEGWDRVQWGNSAVVSAQRSQSFRSEVVPISPPSGGVVDVQIPSAMSPGPIHVEIAVNGPHPAITRCEGPSSCLTPSFMTVFFDVVVEAVP